MQWGEVRKKGQAEERGDYIGNAYKYFVTSIACRLLIHPSPPPRFPHLQYLRLGTNDLPPQMTPRDFCQKGLSLLCRVFLHKKKLKSRIQMVAQIPAKMVDLAIQEYEGAAEGGGGQQRQQQQLPFAQTAPSTSSLPSSFSNPCALPSDLFAAFTRLYCPDFKTETVLQVCVLVREQHRLWEFLAPHHDPTTLSNMSGLYLNGVLNALKFLLDIVPATKDDKWIKMR